MNTISMMSKPFIIPKAPINQIKHSDLASLLTIQPRNLQQFEDFQRSATLNTNDDTTKTYMGGLLEIMKKQISEYGNIAFEIRKNIADKTADTTAISQINEKKLDDFMRTSDVKFKEIFDKLNNFDSVLNNLHSNQESLFNKINTSVERLCEEVRYKCSEQTSLLETSTDQIIDLLNKQGATLKQAKTHDVSHGDNTLYDSCNSLVANQQKRKRQLIIEQNKQHDLQQQRKKQKIRQIKDMFSSLLEESETNSYENDDDDEDDDDYGYNDSSSLIQNTNNDGSDSEDDSAAGDNSLLFIFQ